MERLLDSETRMHLHACVTAGERQQRHAVFRANSRGEGKALVGEDRRLTLSFSSEEAVPRMFGDEILSHEESAADFSRLNDGAPLLWNHDTGRVIGVVEKAWLEKSRGMATVRFARSTDGDEFMALVNDGIVRNVSLAYEVSRYVASEAEAQSACYVATSWRAYEISLVAVPADQSVGVGRSLTQGNHMERNNEDQPRVGRSERLRSQGFLDGREHGEREGREAEASRILTIQRMGSSLGARELAEQLVRSGASIETAREAFLERTTGQRQRPVATVSDFGEREIGMNENEVENFSLRRAIVAAMTGDWSQAGLERAASRAVAQRLHRESQGFFVPPEVMLRSRWTRAPYAVGATATGGALVATNLLAGNFIDVLRNSSRVIEAGATLLTGLVGKVDVPRRTSATGSYWVAESGAITEAESSFDKVSLAPKTLGALSKMSRLTLLQTTPDIEALCRQDLAQVLGLGIDLAALSGSGAGNQPTGIANTAGINSVVGGANGANVTIDHLIAMESEATTDNAPEDSFAYLCNAKTIGTLKALKSTTGQYLWTTSPPGQRSGTPGTINGYPVFRSNQARRTLTKGTAVGVCSELFFGCWSELMIGEWGTLEILVNPFDATGFANGDVLIRAMQTVDIAVKHAESFVVMSDALTP